MGGGGGGGEQLPKNSLTLDGDVTRIVCGGGGRRWFLGDGGVDDGRTGERGEEGGTDGRCGAVAEEGWLLVLFWVGGRRVRVAFGRVTFTGPGGSSRLHGKEKHEPVEFVNHRGLPMASPDQRLHYSRAMLEIGVQGSKPGQVRPYPDFTLFRKIGLVAQEIFLLFTVHVLVHVVSMPDFVRGP